MKHVKKSKNKKQQNKQQKTNNKKHEDCIRHLYAVKLHKKNRASTNKNEKLESGREE